MNNLYFDELDEDVIQEIYKQEEDRIKQLLSDYKAYRRNAQVEMPVNFYKDFYKSYRYIESCGFVTAIEIKCPYAKPGERFFKIPEEVHHREDIVVSLSEELYDVDDELCTVCIMHCLHNFVPQFEDDGYGYYGFPMKDGKYWLVYFQL